ncbi:uncharacterized protein J4E92_007748 [Alternaria infectoria]|uniref:uncharacterized protein n=1 Tax=Alternaria infectoria TaxID=45303 RepID=UPI00221FB7FF|nr:uncharacterized protein J4E92_007748 [Alternaria infectoria]KAI4923774.1 hypothetical protein J4E92_007748 [Alternaria infectoria]
MASENDSYRARKHKAMLAPFPYLTQYNLIDIIDGVERLDGMADFVPFKKEGFETVAIYLVKKAYPNLPETLVEQLGHSIAVRRLRLLRQKEHGEELASREDQDHEAQAVPDERAKIIAQSQDEMAGVFNNLTVADHPALEPTQRPDGASNQPTVESGSNAKSSEAELYRYPRPPQPSRGSDYCRCDWCSKRLSAAKLQRKGSWEYVTCRISA